MLHLIEEYGEYVEITGYSEVSFDVAEAFLKLNRNQASMGIEIQFFDASLIASWLHLYFAVQNAIVAFRGKTNVTKSVAVETVLYAAAERQIQKSIAKIGIKSQTENIAVIIVGKNCELVKRMLAEISVSFGGKIDESVLELTKQKIAKIREVFNISQNEVDSATRSSAEEAVVNLVIERVALLATQI